MLKTDSLRPTKLTVSEIELRCMYCVFFASIGFTPRLVRSAISFLRNDIAAIVGFISNASLALKYVSSLFDSKASLGRFIVTEPRLIVVVFASLICTPCVDMILFDNKILPPNEIISDSSSETSVIFPDP